MIGPMKNNLRRLLPVTVVALAASMLGACQSASVTTIRDYSSATTSAVTSVKTDMLGGLVGQEAINSYLESRKVETPAAGTQAQADMRAYVIWQLSQRS
jgi:methylaspartate ammonia-lyase